MSLPLRHTILSRFRHLGYHPDLIKKAIQTRATTQMNLKDIMLNEIGWSQKDKNSVWFHSCEVPSVVTFTGTENRSVAARGRGEGQGELVCNGDRLPLGEMKELCGEAAGDTTMCRYLMPLGCTLKCSQNGKLYVMYILLLLRKERKEKGPLDGSVS